MCSAFVAGLRLGDLPAAVGFGRIESQRFYSMGDLGVDGKVPRRTNLSNERESALKCQLKYKREG